MQIDHKLLMELSIRSSHFETLADYFDLTTEQRLDPKAAEWIIDRVKQIQTAYFIRRSQVEKIDFPKTTSTLPDQPGIPLDIMESSKGIDKT